MVIVRLQTEEAAFLPGGQVIERPNEKDGDAVDLIVEVKQHSAAKVKACSDPAECRHDTVMDGKKVGEVIRLFSNGYLTLTRQQVQPGTAIHASFNPSGGSDQVLLLPFSALRVTVAGADTQLKPAEPFFSDAPELQIGGAGAEGRWMMLRLHTPAQ